MILSPTCFPGTDPSLTEAQGSFLKKAPASKLDTSVLLFSSVLSSSIISLIFCSQESPRKRVVGCDEGPGRLPEVKAIQQTRRLLANARERTRVHTISAAFEALRKQVPCYSYGQKLSKLAILRIACNYILSLAQLAELDYSSDHSSLSFSQCVEQCTRTLQAEGRSKKRKE
ncbi:protein atonal homolog 8-like [Morone saxatilis]|uniref:protein atonal homolog 8-like n=1 Tax=Morone saxatilis TaxID=34816 RepID=UPI0015E20DEF|nr:protein atonal homolog 8-like [Morone saxatilis]